jgi:hypothetical protein
LSVTRLLDLAFDQCLIVTTTRMRARARGSCTRLRQCTREVVDIAPARVLRVPRGTDETPRRTCMHALRRTTMREGAPPRVKVRHRSEVVRDLRRRVRRTDSRS